jgi:hypothetical protein
VRNVRNVRGVRHVAVGLAVAATGALTLAACSASPSTPSDAPTTHPAGTPTTGQTTTTVTTTPTSATLPPVSTSGPLTVSAPIPLPFSADRVAAAESPDGAVFASPQDPTSSTPAVVWVVDGAGPAVIAEHMPGSVAAMAADSSNLYVASYSNITAFNRVSGNQGAQWSLPKVNAANASDDNLVSMTAAGGMVLITITQGNIVSVYRLNPASSAGPRRVLQSLGAAIGPDGSIYYETMDHHLAAMRPGGASKTGPALAATPNGEGGGVQYVDAVAGGAVWVSEPAGQGLDAQFATFDGATLGSLGSFNGSVTDSFVDTAAGPLALASAGAAACPQASPQTPTSCVFRVDVHGNLTEPAGVGAAVSLVGPGPAVVSSDSNTNQFDVYRLS